MDVKRLEGPATDKAGVKAVVDTIRQLRKEDESSALTDRASRLTAEDNSSVPFELDHDEMRRRVQEIRVMAREKQNGMIEEADAFWLAATLNARKGDVKRAYALANSYLRWRQSVAYEENTPTQSAILKDIVEAGVFVLAGNTSRNGRPVLTIRYRFFDPKRWSALNTARAFGFVVEWILRNYPKSQTYGIVVVEDAAGFSFKNFDLRLISFLDKAFSSILPVRLSALHIVNPGWIIRALFSVFAAFFSDKLKARIRLFSKDEQYKFAAFFEKEHIPHFLDMGGTLGWTEDQQKQLAHKLVSDSLRWAPATTYQAARQVVARGGKT